MTFLRFHVPGLRAAAGGPGGGPGTGGRTVGPSGGAMAGFERAFILAELERDGWNRTRTARRLGVSLRAFMDKLKRYELRGPMPAR